MSAERVVLVGAESTGKTTLARDLCEALARRGFEWSPTRWVPEYGRDYTIEKLERARARAGLEGRPAPEMADLVWTSADFLAIAREQNALEARAGQLTGPVLVCDTDAFATAIWHERYLGSRSAAVEALALARPSLYLLTHDGDVPFEADEIRDGEDLRAWMTEAFVERLRGTQHLLVSVRGARDERVSAATGEIDAWLAGLRRTAS